MTNQNNKTRYTQTVKDRYGDMVKAPRFGVIFRDLTLALAAAMAVLGSTFVVGEGERGVVTRFGEAKYQVDPGLHFKAPFVDGVRKIEVRERKSVEELAAGTRNQLPATTTVSINWTADPSAVMEIYKRYGSLEQFESRILDPKLREAAKAAIGKYNADELIRDRQTVTAEILTILVDLMTGYPVTVNSPQIENVTLPEAYMASVLEKERAREDASREQYNLEKQALVAQQEVQSAEAARDSSIARADGQAYQIRVEAEARADAIRLTKSAEAEGITEVEEALSANPLFVDYTKALQWNGQLPQTILGEGQDILLGLAR